MVDSAIITVLDTTDRAIGDFELPLKITVGELSRKLADVLKAMDSDRYGHLSNLRIEYQHSVLPDNVTLYENGIWDGSIIKIIY